MMVEINLGFASFPGKVAFFFKLSAFAFVITSGLRVQNTNSAVYFPFSFNAGASLQVHFTLGYFLFFLSISLNWR